MNGELKETIYMEVPEFTIDVLKKIVHTEPKSSQIRRKAVEMLSGLKDNDKVCLLKKALYGLRQAGRSWHEKLSFEMKECGLIKSSADPCVFYRGQGDDILIAAVYVDDIIVVSRNKEDINKLKQHLSHVFEIKDLGEIRRCLGIEFSRDKKGIFMNQKGYINELLHRFGMSDSKGVTTPMEVNIKLRKAEDKSNFNDRNYPYRELVGSLMYLAVCTRPDIAHVTSYLSQFNTCHDESHWIAAKRVLRYLKATQSTGLLFRKSNKPLTGYVDADWANCPDDRKSYTGYAFILAGTTVSWESRKQRTVALSSTEAEYMALSESTKEAIHLRNFLLDLGFGALSEITVYCDNNGARKLAENPVFHSRTKHIDVRHHFVREAVDKGLIKITYVSTDNMAADIMTKGLPNTKYRHCKELLGLDSDE